jgi:hypothetical protein
MTDERPKPVIVARPVADTAEVLEAIEAEMSGRPLTVKQQRILKAFEVDIHD